MIYVILHNIRSAHNVGSIFRTADGAGVSKIFLTGYTPRPVDRFGRTVSDIQKTSLGASESVAWEQYDDVLECIEFLKKDGVQIVAVEQGNSASDYREASLGELCAFIFGNEVEGVSQEVCSVSDVQIEIPMYGKKESLNVSVAVGVILFNTNRS